MPYSVYILKSLKDGKYYIGQTSDLEKRIDAHNRGSVKSTKNRRPMELVYSEICASASEARQREHYFKSFKNTKDLLSYLKVAPSSRG
ncbi:MAG: GIY-YIG nuclease family protein [Candidatus Margulisiibacteriota bacterium]